MATVNKAILTAGLALLAAQAALAVTTTPLTPYLDKGYAIAPNKLTKSIVCFDASKKYDSSSKSSTVWSFAATDVDAAFKSVMSDSEGPLSNPDEAKLRDGGRTLLLTGSWISGWAEIDVATKKARRYMRDTTAYNTHSIEKLPDGTLVTANSTGSGTYNNCLVLITTDASGNHTYKKAFELYGAHGVEWDEKRNCLWACGNSASDWKGRATLYKLAYDPTQKTLTQVDSIQYKSDNNTTAHGLRLSADGSIYCTAHRIYKVDPDTKTVTEVLYPLNQAKGVHYDSTYGMVYQISGYISEASDTFLNDHVTVIPVSGNAYDVYPQNATRMYKVGWASALPAMYVPYISNGESFWCGGDGSLADANCANDVRTATKAAFKSGNRLVFGGYESPDITVGAATSAAGITAAHGTTTLAGAGSLALSGTVDTGDSDAVVIIRTPVSGALTKVGEGTLVLEGTLAGVTALDIQAGTVAISNALPKGVTAKVAPGATFIDGSPKGPEVPDVTDSVENLGIPLLTRYPNTGLNAYPRNVWCLQAFDGRIYIGGGNSSNNNPLPNQGPVPLMAYDPSSGTFVTEVAELETEQIDVCHILGDGKLYLPNHDPRDGLDYGDYYRRTAGSTTWEKFRKMSGMHSYDIQDFDGKLVIVGNDPYVSSDGGATFVKETNTGRRYAMLKFPNALFAVGQLGSTIGLDRLAKGGSYVNVYYKQTDFIPRMCPDTDTTDPLRVARPTSFGDRVVYIGGKVHNDHQILPLAAYTAVDNSTDADPCFTAQRIALPEGAVPWYTTAAADKVLILWATGSGSDYTNHVSASTNGVDFTEIFSFRAASFARSMAYLNGSFYFGLGTEFPLNAGNSLTAADLNPASGTILRCKYSLEKQPIDTVIITAEPQEYAVPSAPYGTFDGQLEGKSYTRTISADPVALESGVRARCVGWKLALQSDDGITWTDWQSGTGTSVTYTHPNAPVRLSWQFRTEYLVTVQSSPADCGTQTPETGWFFAGTNLSFTASAAGTGGLVFWRWTGGVTSTDNTIALTVNGPKTLTANYKDPSEITPIVRYVSPTGAGLKDGSTWENASDNLALAYTEAAVGATDINPSEVHLAAGVYTITAPIAMKPYVKVIGATDGETILSGDQGKADYWRNYLSGNLGNVIQDGAVYLPDYPADPYSAIAAYDYEEKLDTDNAFICETADAPTNVFKDLTFVLFRKAAIFAEGASVEGLTIDSCKFYANNHFIIKSQTANGGAVDLRKGCATVKDSIFRYNGFGVRFADASDAASAQRNKVINCQFLNNYCKQQYSTSPQLSGTGGVVARDKSLVDIVGCTFFRCAFREGNLNDNDNGAGAVAISTTWPTDSSCVISNCLFLANASDNGMGGNAACVTASQKNLLEIVGCSFVSNRYYSTQSSYYHSSCITMRDAGARLIVRDSYFGYNQYTNTTSSSGNVYGASVLVHPTGHPVTFLNCTIENNRADMPNYTGTLGPTTLCVPASSKFALINCLLQDNDAFGSGGRRLAEIARDSIYNSSDLNIVNTIMTHTADDYLPFVENFSSQRGIILATSVIKNFTWGEDFSQYVVVCTDYGCLITPVKPTSAVTLTLLGLKQLGGVTARGANVVLDAAAIAGTPVYRGTDNRFYVYNPTSPASASKPWWCLDQHQGKFTDAQLAAVGVVKDVSPVVPDAFGYARAADAVALGPLIDLKADPLPELPANATSNDVAYVLGSASDARLAGNVKTVEAYEDFGTWSRAVEAAGGGTVSAIAGSTHAWPSYALQLDALLAKEIEDEDIAVKTFEATSEAGRFTLTASVGDLYVGDGALPKNLATLFGVTGASELVPGGFSSENVNVTVEPPQDGQLSFTVGPKDVEASAFFMKVQVK